MKDIILNKDAFEFKTFSYESKTAENLVQTKKTYVFILLNKGFIEISTEKTSIILNEGELAFIPPETSYNIVFSEGAVGKYMNFTYWPDVNHFTFPLQKIAIDETLNEHITSIPPVGEVVDSKFIWRAYSFLDIIQDYMSENNTMNSRKIQKAINFMKENNLYTIPQLAKMCNMSECRFYSAFNEIVGMTPIKMKHKIQASKAEFLLLNTDLSIDEIAHNVGFESTAHFRKVFNQHFGCSPKEARKKFREHNNKFV